MTIIPVTEDSEARSSGIAPHPLCDKLDYIAGDYLRYVNLTEKKQKQYQEKHKHYMTLLNDWNDSKYTHWKVNAVQAYLSKDSVIKDLIEYGILKEKEGQLTDDKIEGIEQVEVFVRFKVLGHLGDEEAVYKDTELFNLYIQHYLSSKDKVDLCYVSGKYTPYSNKHPKYIRKPGDGAKLISSKDEGLKYRGRFENSLQVAVIGYEASQKAHKALKWLIARQGFFIDEMYVTCWEMTGKSVPSIEKSTRELFEEDFEEDEDNLFLDSFLNDDKEHGVTVNEVYARKVKNLAVGYKNKYPLEANENVVVMAVEAPVSGRLAINYYRKLSGSQFLDNIIKWHEVCAWQQYYRPKEKDKKGYWWIGAPTPKEIATVAYGQMNTRLIKQTIERLLPCIVDGKPLPRDIMKAAVNRASHFYSFESRYDYRNAVAITCALIRKTEYDKQSKKDNKANKKEVYPVALDRNNRDRSYVYGRLLGAAQRLEEYVLYLKHEKGRETAAERFSQHFAKKPAQTWFIINNSLKPYKAYLKAENKEWHLKELREIYDLIEAEDFISNKPLSELYLLGYNCQLNSYARKEVQLEDTKEAIDNE